MSLGALGWIDLCLRIGRYRATRLAPSGWPCTVTSLKIPKGTLLGPPLHSRAFGQVGCSRSHSRRRWSVTSSSSSIFHGLCSAYAFSKKLCISAVDALGESPSPENFGKGGSVRSRTVSQSCRSRLKTLTFTCAGWQGTGG